MKKQMNYKIISLTVSVLIISFAIAFYAVGWEEPTEDPPAGSIDIPINIGPIGQVKAGALNIVGPLSAEGLFVARNSAYLATLGGNVGIGTVNPIRKLHIQGPSNIEVRVQNTNDLALDGFAHFAAVTSDNIGGEVATVLFSEGSSATYRGGVGTNTNHDFYIRTNEVPRMTINTNGNVGIGTRNPLTPLHIVGIDGSGSPVAMIEATVASQAAHLYLKSVDGIWQLEADSNPNQFRIDEASSIGDPGQARFIIREGGNIGIGTDNPSEKLEVSGNIKASGSICANGGTDCIGGGGGPITSADLDGICGTDGKIIKRISGTWQCADEDTSQYVKGSITGGGREGCNDGRQWGDATCLAGMFSCPAGRTKRMTADADPTRGGSRDFWICVKD